MNKKTRNIFLAILITIFLSELVLMAVLHFVPISSPYQEALLDCILLTIFVGPILYHLIIKKLLTKNLKLEKEKAIHAMASTLAHEINNPLTIALGNIIVLKKEMNSSRIDDIEAALNRINNLVTNIKELEETKAKLDYETLDGRTESVNLN